MDLFVLHNNHAFPSVHALLIRPFKQIWENDSSPEKEEAIRILTYIELVASPKKSNPYFGVPEEDRPEMVKKLVWGDIPIDVSRDMVLIDAVATYKDLLAIASPSLSMFDAAMETAEKIKHQLRTFDMNSRTRSGGLVLKPREAIAALEALPDAVKSLEVARLRVQQELIEDAKTRNQREIGPYER